MRKVLIITVIGLISAFLVAACQPGGEPEGEEAAPATEPAMSDEDAINQIADEFVAAWGDAKAVAALWAVDGDSRGYDGTLFSGREQVEKRYAELFEGVYKDTTFALSATSIRFLQPDVAMVDGSFEIRGMKDADGNDLPATKGMYMNVTIKEGDRWYILCSRPMVPVKTSGTT
jgi:uncharacterized protein (TIGR02246 family)